MKEKNIIFKKILIISIILIIVFTFGNKLESYRQKKAMMNTYVNTMLGKINFCKNSLYFIDDWNLNDDNTPVQYDSLIEEIRFMKDFNSYTAMYMNRYKNSDIFYRISESFRMIEILVNTGLNEEGGFISDGVISENEKMFLDNLHNDLLELEKNLYDYEENKEKNIISLKVYSDIMLDFTNKYSFENIKNIFVCD